MRSVAQAGGERWLQGGGVTHRPLSRPKPFNPGQSATGHWAGGHLRPDHRPDSFFGSLPAVEDSKQAFGR